MAEQPTVCILAGGRGTRLGRIAETVPKPLVQVAGDPFLIHQLRLLARQGFTRVLMCVGHLGDRIEATIGHRYSDVLIEYSYDQANLDGTLGALRRARSRLGRRFLVMYGDTYLRLDYADFYRCWLASSLPSGMTVLRNEGRWDKSNVVYRNGLVEHYEKGGKSPDMKWIDYGLGALTDSTLDMVDQDEHDLSALYRKLSIRRMLFGYEVHERFYDIGTPESLRETDEFLSQST